MRKGARGWGLGTRGEEARGCRVGVTDYRQLKVWQSGVQLVKSVYVLSQRFPKDELYGLTSQMRRAAVSIPANIAEGHARDSTREYLHHISIALGSLAELETMFVLAQELGYSDTAAIAALLQSSEEEGRMLHGLQRTLKSKLNPSP
jgi:four helix bundle protein